MKDRVQAARAAFWHYRKGGREGFNRWRLRRMAERGIVSVGNAEGAEGVWVGRRSRRRLTFRPFNQVEQSHRRNLKVGVILDEFSWRAFAPEWEMVDLTPDNWRVLAEQDEVELIFVESAWNGNDGAWQYQLAGSGGPSKEFRGLIGDFRNAGIPTVFWNKEDPAHFDDFLETAKLFDFVFTTDTDMIPRYREELSHSRVFHLGFAAQPAIHNPIRPKRGWRSRGVAFAGMYFSHKFPERRAQMDLLLSAAVQEQAPTRRLEIFSRMLDGRPEYQFPQPFAKHVVGSLSYTQMLTAYKAYKVFLNVNSVVESPTMCARRVFEVSASGTPVVSTPSRAIASIFAPDEIAVVEGSEEAKSVIGNLMTHTELGDRQVHRAQRRIWKEHTYSHRVEQVLSRALPSRSGAVGEQSVSVLVSSMRPEQLEHVFNTVSRQSIEAELVLLTHGFVLATEELRDLRERYPIVQVRVLAAPLSVSLGECLNQCVAAASGQVLTKMDDDDYYGREYLSDQLNAMMYSKADLVGKQCHYMHFSDADFTVLRFPDKEHRFTTKVMGPTIMATRETFMSFPFANRTLGEDSDFLKRVADAGLRIYSSDRFNYCQNRRSSGHTWAASEHDLALTGLFVHYGSLERSITI